jgi:hypothetical protein
MKINKKGNIDMTGIALSIIILGIVCAVGILITQNVATSQITNTNIIRVNNETGSTALSPTAPMHTQVIWVNEPTDVLTLYTANNGTVCTSNVTTTVSEGTATLTMTSASQSSPNACNNTVMNVTYNRYNASDPRFDVASKASIGLGEYGNWFKIIVIVAISAVILGLIFTAFRGNAEGGSGQSY